MAFIKSTQHNGCIWYLWNTTTNGTLWSWRIVGSCGTYDPCVKVGCAWYEVIWSKACLVPSSLKHKHKMENGNNRNSTFFQNLKLSFFYFSTFFQKSKYFLCVSYSKLYKYSAYCSVSNKERRYVLQRPGSGAFPPPSSIFCMGPRQKRKKALRPGLFK